MQIYSSHSEYAKTGQYFHLPLKPLYFHFTSELVSMQIERRWCALRAQFTLFPNQSCHRAQKGREKKGRARRINVTQKKRGANKTFFSACMWKMDVGNSVRHANK
jgi:hypothetical protein